MSTKQKIKQMTEELATDLAHASIRKYFTVETAPRQPDKWLVECPHCGDMWHLAKNSTHPGNILSLLNHARGHKQ